MQPDQENVQLVPMREVMRIAGISRSEIHRRIHRGAFPLPTRLGPRCSRFNLAEIQEWVRQRLAERGMKAA